MTRVISTRRSEGYVVRGDKLVKLDLPETVDASVSAGTLFVRLREDWMLAGRQYVAGQLLAMDLEKFLDSGTDFDVLFTPGARVSLDSFVPLKSMVLLDLLDNVASRLVEMKRGPDGRWTKRDVEAPRLATLNAVACDRRESDEYFLFVSGFTLPTTLYFAKGGTDAREKLKSLPAFFDATGLEVTQHEATSKDGTKIPYFQVMRKDAKLDGQNPTILYGYGGFEVSQVPVLQRRSSATAGSRRAASGCSPTCAAAASSGRRGTRSRAAKGARRRTTTSPRSRRTSSRARSPRPRSSASWAAARAASS